MKLILKRIICFFFLLPLLAFGSDRDVMMARLSAAKPGDVVTLESKTYQVGDLVVPAGVTLCGAGYDKTVIDATGFRNGVSIMGGRGTVISDLTVRNARENGISIAGASEVVLGRLRVSGNLTGLLLERVESARVENAIIARNRTGAGVGKCSKTVLVNCSFAGNSALALTLSGTTNVAVFNNLIVNSPTAVYLTRDNIGLALDYNFYIASYIGKLEGEAVRVTLPSWQKVSGFDAHSVCMQVDFENAEMDDYRPVNPCFWSPNRAVTSDWGVEELGEFRAPKTDIRGQKRQGDTDLGAFEVTFPFTRKPDGSFKISARDGVKSAGLYNEQGIQVVTFFQNQPLHKGRHDFWIPARDNFNRPLPAGKYELRLVESQLDNPYLGLAGNFGASSDRLDNCSWAEEMFAFDSQDRLYILQNSFENGMGIRAFDSGYKTPRWMMPGGGGNVGGAVDSTWLYYLQDAGKDGYNLRKINIETGIIEPIAPGHSSRSFTQPFSQKVYGMALIKGRLYVSDPVNGKIFHADAADPQFIAAFDVPGALSVTADAKGGLLWVINAEGTLLAVDPASGAVKATTAPVPGIKRIAANNGRLAVLSTTTGKIHVYDITDTSHLKPLNTIGTGDGPYGPQKPDRFWFQGEDPAHMKMSVAINSQGEVAVVDGLRVSFWGADGALKKQGMGFWGQHNYLGRFAGDDDVRAWGVDGKYSIKLDCKNKRWTPDTYWRLPDYDYGSRSPRNYFTTGGKNFGVYEIGVGDPGKTRDGKLKTGTPIERSERTPALLVVRMETKDAVPVSLYFTDSARKTLVELHDSNHDGMIDAKDEAKEIRKADGTAAGIPGDRYGGLPWDDRGDIVFARGLIAKMSGLDPLGRYPVYDWAALQVIPRSFDGAASKMISPYDYKSMEDLNGWVMQLARLSDGGHTASFGLKTSGGTGLANGAGTDIAGYGKGGLFRWLFKMNAVQGSEGVQSLPKFKMVMGMTSTHCDYMVMDEDGLGMGVLSMPRESRWMGMWSDHAQQQQAWIGNDGKPYYILGDYAVNGYHWFEISGMEKTRRQCMPVTLSDRVAAELATLPGLVPQKLPTPPTTKVTIPRLEKPFVINGDLMKWRVAGIPPAAMVTPDSGSADILGPKDCSAIIRLAYQGCDLYVQTIVFDDVVTMHQTLDKLYLQDGLEMGINGFMEGFKFNVSSVQGQGPVVFRNKFVVPSADRLYTQAQVPRSITVFDRAQEIEERHFIEAIYGVDLSQSKAIVTEYKLPLTPEIGLAGDPSLIKTVGPGGTTWIGFYINDNDVPGGDVQKLLTWPATYSTFGIKSTGALATFE